MNPGTGTYVIGIDAGTTSIKGLILDSDGNIIATAGEEYELETGPGDICEVDPEVYWNVTCLVIQKLLSISGVRPAGIKGLAFSSQGETIIMVDSEGRPLRKAIVWLDNRSVHEAGLIEMQFGNQRIMDVTGQPVIQAIWPATRILWIRENEPDVFRQVHKFLLVEDYLIFKLTGKFCTEYSLVSSTLYFDINTRRWWDEMLGFLEITESKLPSLMPTGSAAGQLTSEAAARTGLSAKTTVITGAYDHPAGAIGAANLKPGMVSLTIGAAMAMCVTLDKPVRDIHLKLPCQCHALPGLYFLLPYTQTAGLVLKWFRDEFGKEEDPGNDPYDLLVNLAEQVPPGADGLTMLPHFMGTGSPEFNPAVKGVFAGISLGMHKGHFVRSILEAVAAAIERNMEAMREKEIVIREIILLGGGAKSNLWAQIIADMTGLPVITNTQAENASLGAAILAGTGTSLFCSIEQAVSLSVSAKLRIEPDTGNYQIYRKVYLRYLELYTHLEAYWEVQKNQG